LLLGKIQLNIIAPKINYKDLFAVAARTAKRDLCFD
jgi:hypothetical protein